MTVDYICALNGVTATTTSSKIWVGDYDSVAILFRRAANAGGTSTFTVKAGFGQLPSDSPTMTAYNMLIDNNSTFAYVSSKAIANANGDAMVWMSSECPATHIEVTATETADGTHSAWIIGFKA